MQNMFCVKVAIFYALLLFLSCDEKQKEEHELLKDKCRDKENEFHHFKNLVFYQNKTNNLPAQKKIYLLKNKDTIDLCQERGIEKYIFFYFNEYHCTSCVKDQLSLIDKFNAENENIFIRIIANYGSQRNLNLFVKANNISSPVDYITGDKINLPIATYNIPFYFLINDRKEIIQVSIADKEDISYTEMYLKEMKKRIQKEF